MAGKELGTKRSAECWAFGRFRHHGRPSKSFKLLDLLQMDYNITCGNNDNDRVRPLTVYVTVCSIPYSVSPTVIFLPAVPQVLHKLNYHNQLYSVFLLSIWELGGGLGPFVVAPLSESYVRLPVFHIANLLFTLFTIGSALSCSPSMLVAFRFLNRVTVATLTLGPGIAGDMFTQDT